MRILMIANGMDIGGAETHIVELATALIKKGVTVAVAAPDGVFTPALRAVGAICYEIPSYTGTPVSLIRQARTLARVVRAVKPDIMHAHARPCALCASILSRRLHIPLVTTAHLPFKCATGTRCLTKWGEGSLAVCREIADHLTSYYSIPASDILLTVNGIDTRYYSCQKGDGCERIVHISRLDADRADTAARLIRLAPRLALFHICHEIVIVGDGDKYHELRHRASAINRRIGKPFVRMMGAQSDIRDFLIGRPVFVGVSRAALEAMACECTVILAGNEGYGGLLFVPVSKRIENGNFCCRSEPPATDERLFQDLCRAFSLNNEERAAIGRDNRRYIETFYTPNRMAEDAILLYSRVLRQHKRSGIMVCGYHGYGNTGDDLSLVSLISASGLNDRRVTVLCKSPVCARALFGVHTLGRYRLLTITSSLRRGDMFIFGGGNLLQNQTGNRSLLYYLLLAKIARMRHADIAMIRGGLGELHGRFALKYVRCLLSQCQVLTLRTPQDCHTARLLCPTCTPMFSCDATLLSTQTATATTVDRPYLTVVLRAPRNVEKGAALRAATLVKALCRKNKCRAVFVLFHPEADFSFTDSVANLIPDSSICVVRDYHRLLSVMHGGVLTLTSRLHAAYLSVSADTPCIMLPYDRKTAAHERYFIRCASLCGNQSPVVPATNRYIESLPTLGHGDFARLRAAVLTSGRNQ